MIKKIVLAAVLAVCVLAQAGHAGAIWPRMDSMVPLPQPVAVQPVLTYRWGFFGRRIVPSIKYLPVGPIQPAQPAFAEPEQYYTPPVAPQQRMMSPESSPQQSPPPRTRIPTGSPPAQMPRLDLRLRLDPLPVDEGVGPQ